MRKYIALIVAICAVFFVFQKFGYINQSSEFVENKDTLLNNAVVDSSRKQPYVAKDVDDNMSTTASAEQNPDRNLAEKETKPVIPGKQIFDSNKFNSFIFSSDFLSQKASFISDRKNNRSYESELHINEVFNETLRTNPEFSKLSLELAECDVEACVVSLAGVENLSTDEISKLEDEMLFNKSGMAKVATRGSGGTYGIFNDNGISYFRIVYIATESVVGVH